MAEPRHYHVRYTLTVDADAVPAGETVRCWLPYPRKDVPRQGDVRFIAASESEYVFSEETCAHSTLYMEKKAVAGQPTVFSEEFEYTIYGEWHPLYPESVKEYNVSDPEYKHYTSEREAHIKFTPRIKAVADSLSKGLDNPYLIARTFFTWVNDNFPWASAREYSTVENIPMYVLESGHGDCGMVTLLFMTLCRYKGIPTRWQSGFMMHPSGWNLHDWAEVYFEGPGWVPVDESFGIPSYAVRRAPLMGTWAPAMSLPAASGAAGVAGASGIGAAGVSAVPMAARVVHKEGVKEDPSNFLLMHAMGPNVSGVIGSAVAAGVLLALCH
jgi:transglutaminase-like putative cysteine protease